MDLRPLRTIAALALSVGVLGACSRDGDRVTLDRESGTSSSTSTSAADETTTTTTAATSTSGTPAPSVTGTPASTQCPATADRVAADPKRPKYELTVDVKPAEGVVTGTVDVRFTPDLDTDRLVFRLWPNGPLLASAGSRLDVGQVTVDGRAAEARQTDPTTLVVSTPPLKADRTVAASVPFTLKLPNEQKDRIARNGDSVRLGSFFPILPWERGVGWALEPPTTAFAEASMAPVADFRVRVSVPPQYRALVSGTETAGVWEANEVRDVAVAVGRFTVESRTVDAGRPVVVTVGVHQGISEKPSTYMGKLERSLKLFASLYGPYPWPAYTLSITPTLGGGIEYPMHVMQGPGTVGRTTSHEVAHMWFYGLVGNNQGRDPWLDEGLASYAEARFEGTLGSFKNVKLPAGGAGHVGEPMTYWETRKSIYYRTVYQGGAQAIASLGTVEQTDCVLRHLVARNAHTVARPADVVAAANAAGIPDAAAKLASFGIRT